MKLSKKTFYLLLINIILLPLFGNEDLNEYLHINILVTILNYIIPLLLSIFLLIDGIKQKKIIKKDAIFFSTIVFWLITIISFVFSITHQIYNFSNLFKFICMTFLIIVLKDVKFNKQEKKVLCYTILSISTFIAILGIGQYVFQINLNKWGIEKYIGALGRVNSSIYIATLLDKYLALNIFLILFFIYKKYTNFYISIVSLIINILALVFTFSRTGLLILLFIVICFIIIFLIKKKIITALVLTSIIIGMYFIPGENFVFSSLANYFIDIGAKISEKTNISLIDKTAKKIFSPFVINMENFYEASENEEEIDLQLSKNIDYSLLSRNSYKLVAKAILKEHWKFGIGIGSYTYIYENQNANEYLTNNSFKSFYRYPHSMYLQLGAETGIFGLISFFFIIIYSLIKSSIKNKTIFPIILLISILLMCYTETIFYMKDISYITIISIALLSNTTFLKKEY